MKKQNFLALGDLVRNSNKVFIKRNSLFLAHYFLCQQQTYMMEWLRDNVMWLRLTTIRYFLSRKKQEPLFLSKKSFYTRRSRKKKIFSDIFDQKLTDT